MMFMLRDLRGKEYRHRVLFEVPLPQAFDRRKHATLNSEPFNLRPRLSPPGHRNADSFGYPPHTPELFFSFIGAS